MGVFCVVKDGMFCHAIGTIRLARDEVYNYPWQIRILS